MLVDLENSLKSEVVMQFSKYSVFICTVICACTHHVKIEPSDKPFVVNLNVKIDHEVKLQIKEQNQDLLNLEDTVLKGET